MRIKEPEELVALGWAHQKAWLALGGALQGIGSIAGAAGANAAAKKQVQLSQFNRDVLSEAKALSIERQSEWNTWRRQYNIRQRNDALNRNRLLFAFQEDVANAGRVYRLAEARARYDDLHALAAQEETRGREQVKRMEDDGQRYTQTALKRYSMSGVEAVGSVGVVMGDIAARLGHQKALAGWQSREAAKRMRWEAKQGLIGTKVSNAFGHFETQIARYRADEAMYYGREESWLEALASEEEARQARWDAMEVRLQGQLGVVNAEAQAAATQAQGIANVASTFGGIFGDLAEQQYRKQNGSRLS